MTLTDKPFSVAMQELFDELAKHKEEFELFDIPPGGADGLLRHFQSGLCPIVFVFREKFRENIGNGGYSYAGRKLQLTSTETCRLMWAADNQLGMMPDVQKDINILRHTLLTVLALEALEEEGNNDAAQEIGSGPVDSPGND